MSALRRLAILLSVAGAAAAVFAATGGLRGAGHAAAQTPSPSPLTVGPTAPPTSGPGRELYLEDCAYCHGALGEGGNLGPPLIGVGAASADFMLSTGRMPISKPEAQPRRRPPAYTPEEIRELVAFVSALGPGGPPIPDVDPARGSLGQGAELFEGNCAACHGSVAAGGALTSGLEAPSLIGSTPVQTAEAIRLGGAGYRTGKMPKFGPDLLNDHEVDSIARYVEYLQDPQDRGGQNLGHLGPIPEGAVAWLVGLLALVVFVRWIGTTR
jgi:ubiquinol-cytochrome c reductase cytochrome c subunit